MIGGKLQFSSPSLWGLLGRYFSPAERDLAAAIYEKCLDLIPSESPAIPRESGVSFNPHPARLAEILVRESGSRDFELVLAALISAAPLPKLLLLDCEIPHGTVQILEDLHRPGAHSAQTLRSQILRFTVALDDLRHLHLRSDAACSAEPLCRAADQLLAAPEGIPDRLVTLVQAARDRAYRRILTTTQSAA